MSNKEKKLFSVVWDYDPNPYCAKKRVFKYGHTHRFSREKFFKADNGFSHSEIEVIANLEVHETMTVAGVIVLRLHNTTK